MINEEQYKDKAYLITAFKNGENGAFKYVYKQNYWLVFNLVKKYSAEEEDFKDIYQETIIAFYENVVSGKYVQKSNISTYLYAIARNICTKKFKVLTQSLESVAQIPSSEDDFELGESSTKEERIKNYLLNDLKIECRKLLVLFYYNNKSLAEIAQELSFTVAYVKNKKSRCMEYFRTIVIEKEKINGQIEAAKTN